MRYAILKSNGVYAGEASEANNPPRPLIPGETVVEAEVVGDVLYFLVDGPDGSKVIGDPIPLPEPVPQPDWAGFTAGIPGDGTPENPGLSFYAAKILLGPPSNLFSALASALKDKDATRINELLPRIKSFFNLTDDDSVEFQALADLHHIPITVP
jgi:hypothetical protein